MKEKPPQLPLCVTKFGKNMDPSQSFHVCSQLPAEKAKGSLPGKPIRLLREALNRAEEEKARFQKEELFTIKANWVPHRHSVSYTKTKDVAPERHQSANSPSCTGVSVNCLCIHCVERST
ncbi:Hypothetical predicted protein [Lynx pardinus]|uniref:Uncharacterized protein n=1 Tax=Lynx pardinus TaxID=191816 RepID=A0A485PMG2_LYNPA|nr:Hypothetical predicted protein [Lynx pardinus]